MTLVSLGTSLGAEAATATWDRNPEPDVLGYVLAYGTQPGTYSTYIDVGNVLSYEFFPPSGYRYYVVVFAYNANGYGPPSSEAVLDLGAPANQPPTLVQPSNQSSIINAPVSLALSASDPEGASLTYTASGLPAGLGVHLTTGVISGTPTTAGTFAVTAAVSDGALTTSRSFTWLVTAPEPSDTTPPVVTITAPVHGSTVGGKKVTLAAHATDAGGVSGVQFLLDGVPIGVDDTTSPFTVVWNSTSTANGTHELTAVARDAAGNRGISAVATIVVRNGGRRQ